MSRSWEEEKKIAKSNGINQTRTGDFGSVRERWIIANGVGVTTIDNGEEVQIREAVRGAEPTGAGITTTRHLAVGTRGGSSRWVRRSWSRARARA